MKSLKDDLKTSQNLNSAALLYTTTYSKGFTDLEVFIKFSVAVTETITITLDSKGGETYDTVLRTKSLYTENNFVFKTDMHFFAGDNIKIQCTKANSTGIAYVTVKAKQL